MKKKILIIVFAVAIILLVYLNRTYAYFFDNIGDKNLANPNLFTSYPFLAPNVPDKRDIVYIALGDSLTAGVGAAMPESTFPYKFAQSLNLKHADVTMFNFAEPGARTDRLLSYQIPRIKDLYPNYITLLIGINDVLNNKSPEEYEGNLGQILDELAKFKNAKVFVLNIPYLGAKNVLFPPYPLILDLRIQQFNKITASLVNKYPFTYIDLYTQTKIIQGDEFFYSPDGFHPSDRGYQQWGEIINAHIDK